MHIKTHRTLPPDAKPVREARAVVALLKTNRNAPTGNVFVQLQLPSEDVQSVDITLSSVEASELALLLIGIASMATGSNPLTIYTHESPLFRQ